MDKRKFMIQRNITFKELRFYIANRHWLLGRVLPEGILYKGALVNHNGDEIGYYITDFNFNLYDVYEYDFMAVNHKLESTIYY